MSEEEIFRDAKRMAEEEIFRDAKRMAEILTEGRPPLSIPDKIREEFASGRRLVYYDFESGIMLIRKELWDIPPSRPKEDLKLIFEHAEKDKPIFEVKNID